MPGCRGFPWNPRRKCHSDQLGSPIPWLHRKNVVLHQHFTIQSIQHTPKVMKRCGLNWKKTSLKLSLAMLDGEILWLLNEVSRLGHHTRMVPSWPQKFRLQNGCYDQSWQAWNCGVFLEYKRYNYNQIP